MILVTLNGRAVRAAEVQKTLTLSEALQLTVRNSRDVKAAQESLDAAESAVSKASSGFYPTLTATAQTGTFHDRLPNPGDLAIPDLPRDRNSYSGRLEARAVLFSGFSTVAEVQQAKANRRIESQRLTSKEQAARMDAITTYFAIQTVHRKIHYVEEILKLQKSQLDRTKSRQGAGRATDLDVMQAEYAVHEQEPLLNTLTGQLENLSLHLNRLMGVDVSQTYRLTDQLESSQEALDRAHKSELTAAFQGALDRNSELKELDAQFEKANAELKLEDAKNLPVISARAFSGIDTFLQNEIGTQNSQVYGYLLEVQIPLFSGFSTLYTVQEKKSRINAVTEQRSLQREKLLEHLQQLYRQVETDRRNLTVNKLNIEIAKKAVSRAEALHTAGRATLTDVLDTYSRLLSAEERYMDHLNASIQTHVQIKAEIGE